MAPRVAVLVISLLSLWAVAEPALAKKSDREQPISTVAKVTNAYASPNSVTTLSGNVKVVQGSLVVTGDVVQLYFDASQHVSRAVATGRPAHIHNSSTSRTGSSKPTPKPWTTTTCIVLPC